MANQYHYPQTGVAMTCRSYQEYCDMFAIRDEDMQGRTILDVAGGASSFTAEAGKLGHQVQAVDILYDLPLEMMSKKGHREHREASDKIAKLAEHHSWDYYGSPERHKRMRLASLQTFLQDYAPMADVHSRYVAGRLPNLPFADCSFHLIVCSHFLFLYEEQFDYAFHLRAIRELVRLLVDGGELRIYPLCNLRGEPYTYLHTLQQVLAQDQLVLDIMPTSFRFMPQAHQVLRIRKC